MRVVPRDRAAVIERMGRYRRTATAGTTVFLPFVDRMCPLVDLREQVVSFPPQPVITSDNRSVAIGSIVRLQVTDPRAVTYEVHNCLQAVEQLTGTAVRHVVAALSLEQTLSSRGEINAKLQDVLADARAHWGVQVASVEIEISTGATAPA